MYSTPKDGMIIARICIHVWVKAGVICNYKQVLACQGYVHIPDLASRYCQCGS